jgi:heat shock protein HtpX
VVGFFGELFFRMFTNLSWNSTGGGWSTSSSSSSSSSSSQRDGKGSGGGAIVVVIVAVVLIIVAWLLSQVVKLALSRSSEYLADAGSVELTKTPDAMISAPRKIENRGELPGATSAVMELCVDDPREGFTDLFATDPSVQSRVDSLVKFTGGRDPGPLPVPDDSPEPDQKAGSSSAPDQPSPLPHGLWNNATESATAPPPGTETGPWSRYSGCAVRPEQKIPMNSVLGRLRI